MVISTLNRATALNDCLQSLRHQTYDNFEVVLVNGPSTDWTSDVLAPYASDVKLVQIGEANLSKSRNQGIAAAAGEFVAFLDDDAIAEPGWIENIVQHFSDPAVGGVGTRVWDHLGFREQDNPRLIDEYYSPDFAVVPPLWAFHYTDALSIPHVLGASSSFRVEVLRAIGGFDEEIEYFLDESEVCRRVSELGFRVVFVNTGPSVHHKYLTGVVRDERKVLTNPYPVVKNKFYATLSDFRRRGRPLAPAIERCEGFARDLISRAREDLSKRIITTAEFEFFAREVGRGIVDGRSRGLNSERMSYTFPPHRVETFRVFPTVSKKGKSRSFCFISRHLPAASPGGVAKFMLDLAMGFANEGHRVTFITATDGPSQVSYDSGLWIRSLCASPPDLGPDEWFVDDNVNSAAARRNVRWSAIAHAEVKRISRDAAVDLVIAPIWDTEGLHCILDDTLSTVLTLQTTFNTFYSIERAALDSSTVEELLVLERLAVGNARLVHAISDAICEQVGSIYPRHALSTWGVARLGIDDCKLPARSRPSGEVGGRVRVLYVSRLERRKGIDLFISAALELARRHPEVEFDVVGRASGQLGASDEYRSRVANAEPSIRSRIVFRGEVSDECLLQAYSDADIFCVPSRFESFGLVYLEAMRASLPVVACNVGGVSEIVSDDITGLLVRPGDVAALCNAIGRLVADRALRRQLGREGRIRFESEFETGRMTDRVLTLYNRFLDSGATSLAGVDCRQSSGGGNE